MKKKIKTVGRVLLIVVVVFAALAIFRVARIQTYFLGLHTEFFDGKHTEAYLPPTPSDYFTAQKVLKTADEAFGVIENSDDYQQLKSDMEKKYGKLARYCVLNYSDAVSEEHDLSLLTANFKDDGGYMWVAYTQGAYDENGKTVLYSGCGPTRWELEKKDGEWTVVGIIEHP